MRRARLVAFAFALAALSATAADAQFFTPSPQTLTHAAFRYEAIESGDAFGRALAAGDFDGDGVDDLAVAAPGESDGGLTAVGTVAVAYGGLQGLRTNVGPSLRQTWDGTPSAEAFDLFGGTLAAGDFDGDGFDDLVVGTPEEDSSGTASGVVQVLHGTSLGVHFGRVLDLQQGRDGIDGEPEGGDLFGLALAVGDFDGDGFDDLAVGVPGEDLGWWYFNQGAVHVFSGGPEGLSPASSHFLEQSEIAGGGSSEEGDNFGWTLAAGDFDGDGFADLAIGVPGEDDGGVTDCGAVSVVYGSPGGIDPGRGAFFWQNSAPSLGIAERNDHFGLALASADFNGDGRDDLAVGVPDEDLEPTSSGAVAVLFGSASGLTAAGGVLLHQNAPGVPDTAEANDRFGEALAAGRLDGDGFDDLVVGVPGENGAGATQAFRGGAAGLQLTGASVRFQPGTGAAEAGDRYGLALALGDFDGNGLDDLAAGAPDEGFAGLAGAGQVDVRYSAPPDVIGLR